MTDRLQAAREALEPFALVAAQRDEHYDNPDHYSPTIEDFRRAREALALLQSGPDTSRQSSETAELLSSPERSVELLRQWRDYWRAQNEPGLATMAGDAAFHLHAALDAAAEGQGWQPTHRHYKGGLYRLIAHGRNESDLSPVMIYENAEGETWVRVTLTFVRN